MSSRSESGRILPELGKCTEEAERWVRHGKQLDIATLPSDQCNSFFRFEKCGISRLVVALAVPQN